MAAMMWITINFTCNDVDNNKFYLKFIIIHIIAAISWPHHAKTAKLYKRVRPSKHLSEKVVKSKVAAMEWLQ